MDDMDDMDQVDEMDKHLVRCFHFVHVIPSRSPCRNSHHA